MPKPTELQTALKQINHIVQSRNKGYKGYNILLEDLSSFPLECLPEIDTNAPETERTKTVVTNISTLKKKISFGLYNEVSKFFESVFIKTIKPVIAELNTVRNLKKVSMSSVDTPDTFKETFKALNIPDNKVFEIFGAATNKSYFHKKSLLNVISLMDKECARRIVDEHIKIALERIDKNGETLVLNALINILKTKKSISVNFLRDLIDSDIFNINIRDIAGIVFSGSGDINSIKKAVEAATFGVFSDALDYAPTTLAKYDSKFRKPAAASAKRRQAAKGVLKDAKGKTFLGGPEEAVEQETPTRKKTGTASLDAQLREIKAERARTKKAAETKGGKEAKKEGLPEEIKTDVKIKGAERK